MQAGGIDDHPGLDAHRLRATDVQIDAVASNASALHRAAQCDRRAARFRVALVGEHQAMAVDDACRWREKCGDAGEFRLHGERLCLGQRLQIADPVGLGLGAEFFQRGPLPVLGGDDELAAAPVRDAVLFAIAIERELARNAQLRLQRPRRVIDAGMDDLAVARARMRANRVLRFQHHDLAALERQAAGNCQPDHAGADYDAINAFHGRGSRPDGSRGAGAANKSAE